MPCWAGSSCACFSAEELACPSHKYPARTQTYQLTSLQQRSPWRGHALPSGDEGLPFPKACPAVSSSEPIKAWCHLSFRLSSILKNIKEKERCVLLSTPAAARAAHEPSPSESKRSQRSCSSSPDEGQVPRPLSPAAPRAQRCTAQPQPFPAIPPASPPLIQKAFRRQGSITCKERNEAGP